MARVNFREIRDRFTHLDATFESCAVRMPGDSHYAVRFYPWWENPAYRELVESGVGWRGAWPDKAAKVVTVYPVGLVQACVRETPGVIDWVFVEPPDPLLWEYETKEHVLCKSGLPPGTLIDLPSMIAGALHYHADLASLSSLLSPLQWGDPRVAESERGGFSLGRFPASVVGAVRSVLDDLGVEYFDEAVEARSETLPVALLIDGTDYLIAEDFEVDVPHFQHKPDWVTIPSVP